MKSNFEKFCEHFSIDKATVNKEEVLIELKNADGYNMYGDVFTLKNKVYELSSQDYEVKAWIRYLNDEIPKFVWDGISNTPEMWYGTYSLKHRKFINESMLPIAFYPLFKE